MSIDSYWTESGVLSRRDVLRRACCGFGSLPLAWLAAQEQAAAAPVRELSGGTPHFAATARSVIFLFMSGGPSHLETFDPKPLLNRLNGQVRPQQFGDVKYQFVNADSRLLGTERKFRRYGESGIEVSDLWPQVSRHVDDLAVIRSCYGDMVVHSAAQYELFSGRIIPGYPSMGSWVAYGLGAESQALPAYVVMPDPRGALEAGQPLYMNGFLPAAHQPMMLRPGAKPVLNLASPEHVSPGERADTWRLIGDLNRVAMRHEDSELEARIRSYDLAFRMQTEGPQVFDLSRESAQTLAAYGVGSSPTDDYGRRCLLARRLVEQGVRFVCVVSGGGSGTNQWDAHQDIEANHQVRAAETDQPIAALLGDLKQRGLLETTLVVWGGEFGRSPESEGSRGRDHHNLGFTMWMAGGGVRGGQVIGATDEIGLRAIERPVHFRDLHATILERLGLDQHRLTFPHLGRDERLTFIEGRPIRELTSSS